MNRLRISHSTILIGKDIPDEKADLMRSPHQQYESTWTFAFKFTFFTMFWKKVVQPSWRIRRSPARFISSRIIPFSTPDSITLPFARFSKFESCSSALRRSSYLNTSTAKPQNWKPKIHMSNQMYANASKKFFKILNIEFIHQFVFVLWKITEKSLVLEQNYWTLNYGFY